MRGRLRSSALAGVLAALMALPAFAVQPDEVLDDPALEARARQISEGLRCLVCRNESIDESNASLARDLRLLVRERLVEGDTNEEAVAYIVERYGEYVLLNPQADGWNWLLWAAGPLMLLTAAGLGAGYLRGRSKAAPQTEAALSPEEEKRLKDLLDDV
ncbi:cytochrome c-type biogenesis protein CcmH [Roseivivax lentus]|uniref:Cytochrome c-type biogenesis protein n=1 Tax=Roseivivax lentus TaxID=633194 RepID=A0A1N7N7A1_9RHOB|nr:cytochrome c-type biogenesis protein CcmH [Roseivivax lentus]